MSVAYLSNYSIFHLWKKRKKERIFKNSSTSKSILNYSIERGKILDHDRLKKWIVFGKRYILRPSIEAWKWRRENRFPWSIFNEITTSSGGQAGATRDRSRFASGCRIRSRRCEYSWAFMSVDYTPATILCLPWKGWTVNSARPTWPVDPLTADQRDQWRTKGAVTTQETRLFISLPLKWKVEGDFLLRDQFKQSFFFLGKN